MNIVNLLINEKVLKAELAVAEANVENIIELCRDYLFALNEYRDQLHQFKEIREINIAQRSVLARELIEQARKAIRAAVEVTTSERNKIETLLNSFISINGYSAASTLNDFKFDGFDTWELRGSQVSLKYSDTHKPMSIADAVASASMLRRRAYIERTKKMRADAVSAL